MSTKFYTLLTDIGAAKLASAAALGVPFKNYPYGGRRWRRNIANAGRQADSIGK